MAVTDQTDEATTTTAAATTQTTIDAGSPLYIHPSDSPGSSLVPVPFDGIGYRSWRRSVLRALSVKNKLGFITGDTEKPDIADSVEYVNDSVELWKELQDRYDQTNGAKLYQIQKEINDLSQGVLDITGYYTKMKKLWEELNTLSVKAHCSCICTCGAKENMHKAKQDRRLVQFLMRLNEVYTVVRGSILMMNPFPNMAQAFALLIQEEKQREFRPRNQLNIDSTALNANLGGKNFKTNYSTGTGNQAANNRAQPFCDYCKRQGHTKDKCYKLHGYPQSFNQGPQQQYRQGAQGYNNNTKFNKGRIATTNAVTNVEEGEKLELEGESQSQNVSLTKEQYGQTVSLLQHFQTASIGEGSASANMISGASMSFAGMIACTSSIDFDNPSCKYFSAKADLWILDSGASHHMTFNKSHLQNIVSLPYPLLVKLPNGYKVKAPSLKRPLEIGKLLDGLYFLCSKCLKKGGLKQNYDPSCLSIHTNDVKGVHCLSHSFNSLPIVNSSIYNSKNKDSDSALFSDSSPTANLDILWHFRLGHVPFSKMRGIPTIPATFSTNNLSYVISVPWPDNPDFLFPKEQLKPLQSLKYFM
ncbi:PREDICTED: uncharacterized protein LOC109231594 [Nicotiana attenuata]|uniref:uncharacterized protein LOC109231594 n=1 Tax=Nicotiana attenuata TaxID=49451 RepID=UPI0009046457|nr:PREDICTED: uncharacterized protein LOC109231594 [Nicotiana attenuata]